ELPADDASAKTLAPGAKPEMVNVDWLEYCTLHFEGDDPDNLVINRADLFGSVLVKTRQIDMNSDALKLYFAPPDTTQSTPTTRPTTRPGKQADMDAGDLESLVAYDDVHTVMDDGSTADAVSLEIRVQDGKKAITLQGQPAIVTRKTGKLIGNIIHIVPDLE